MLQTLLDNEMKNRRLSSRDVAQMTGLSHTTILRFLKGDQPDLKSVMKICNALGIDPQKAMGVESSDIAVTIAALIDKHPLLGRMFESIIRDYQEGKLSEEDVNDILAYAAFRIEKAQK
jgi:transcriptional regulator with XRE-family HTH domain